MIDASQKLSSLRALLAKEGVDGFIVPHADEYQGEYIPESADRLRWLSAFTGSAGHAVVLKNRACVFSDGRYTIQLKQQVDAEAFETRDSTKTSIADWLEEAGETGVIGYDARLHTPQDIKKLADRGVALKPLAVNPVDEIWTERPPAPSSPVALFPLEYAGVAAQDKLDEVAKRLKAAGCSAAIITLPDSIAWLLNVRADDIAHIPVALSNAVAHQDGTLDWFIDPSRVPEDVRRSFGNRVALVPPEKMPAALSTLKGGKVLVDGRRTAAHIFDILQKAGVDFADLKDPVIALKARKNAAEKEAMRRAHIRDGVAVTKFLKWLSEEGPKGALTEFDAEARLEQFRREAPEYRDSSFDTIAGYGPHGAIVHYRATKETNARIQGGSLLLLDSGAQYADGTTDITRTVAIGKPDAQMVEHFTLVLKGHIAVAAARFPHGTTGAQIDALARAPLWRHNLDYAHGTGHGVGCYLSVHEEAASLSPRGTEAVDEGMILSNEPGYYREGAYGIRLENLVLVREDGTCEATGKKMLCFETLTFAPFDKSLIDESRLSEEEKLWLANYHKKVFAEVSPYLDGETAAWLHAAT